jgi:type II secretory pathway pseudopilin PulG
VKLRLRDEKGQGLIELVAAMAVLAIAIMALMAGYGSAWLSIGLASQKTVAASLADKQLELYGALPYTKIGLDAATLTGVQTSGSGSYDAQYVSDKAALSDPAGTSDATINCTAVFGSLASQCLPIQTTNIDGTTYRIETFIRNISDPVWNTGISWTERAVTVVVQNSADNSEFLRETGAFDRGP